MWLVVRNQPFALFENWTSNSTLFFLWNQISNNFLCRSFGRASSRKAQNFPLFSLVKRTSASFRLINSHLLLKLRTISGRHEMITWTVLRIFLRIFLRQIPIRGSTNLIFVVFRLIDLGAGLAALIGCKIVLTYKFNLFARIVCVVRAWLSRVSLALLHRNLLVIWIIHLATLGRPIGPLIWGKVRYLTGLVGVARISRNWLITAGKSCRLGPTFGTHILVLHFE